MTINYRQAVPSDVIDLIGLVEEYCDESGLNHDLATIKKYIDFQLGKIPALIADEDGKVVGVISFIVMPSPFLSTELLGRKIACFVSKNKRDLGIGKELLTRAEVASKESGAIKFYFTSTEAPEGYATFETEFYKVL